MGSKKNIRLLLVDDSDDDRDLILMNLRRGGYSPEVQSVDTRKDFEAALAQQGWDLIICDYSMPGFDGITALNILKKEDRDIPFILVSGAIGEELAVKAMKAGADDYLMKDNLQRLVPAIERELKDAEIRKKHREAQRERDRLLTVIQNSLNEIYIFDCKTLKYRYLNHTAIENLGYDADQVYRMTPIDINPELNDPEEFYRIIKPLLDGELEKDHFLTKHERADGSSYPIEIHIQLIKQDNEQFFTAIGFDLTDREKDAQRIREQKEIAREMAQHSKHKSQFLANMSHELRTPLNSILLLSELLLKSKNSNLTKDQLKYADVIYRSGNNLLELINEVLDLAKIESGEMELSMEEIPLEEIITNIRNTFDPIAREKNLTFNIETRQKCPPGLVTDQLKLEQILRNLLSNALKFTDEGRVDLTIYPIAETESSADSPDMICFQVRDTGIGIPSDKQSLVFESFRQADGSTQRKYGGTGLGLAICKQISELLGGDLSLESKEDEGSTFTLTIPIKDYQAGAISESPGATGQRRQAGSAHSLESSSTINRAAGQDTPELLIISDDREIQQLFLNASDHRGVNAKTVNSGQDALSVFNTQTPSIVAIDLCTPGLSGWSVAKQLSDAAGDSTAFWMIIPGGQPVPGFQLPRLSGLLQLPATHAQFEEIFQSKPAQKKRGERTLLLIDDNRMHNEALCEFAADIVDRCLTANTAGEAYEILDGNDVHCIVLDLSLPDSSGHEVLKTLANHPVHHRVPVIIYSGRSLSTAEKKELKEHASDVIFKNVGSHSKLMDKISTLLFNSPESAPGPEAEKSLAGKEVLIVEDDEQSYFSLSSHLQPRGLTIYHANNGVEALEFLTSNPGVDIVLMDIMMPEMDGFEALKRIRATPALENLPVITITAKAMKGDREECLELGATDYISKPVDPVKLITLLSIWVGS